MESTFKLDRTAFKALSALEADEEMRNHKGLTVIERLQLLNYLNSMAYNYPMNQPPKLERIFSGARRMVNE